jgi:hypothetical protein
MRILSFVYRFLTNFAFLALVYVSLNYIEKYNNRASLAILVLVYAGMRAATALRTFYFFGRIERLEVESRRLFTLITHKRRVAAAARRRDQILYRPVLPGGRGAALRLQDRDGLNSRKAGFHGKADQSLHRVAGAGCRDLL